MYRSFYSALMVCSLIGCGKSAPAVAGGKSTQQWLEARGDSNPKVRMEAVKKLGNIGVKDSAALPAVLESLTDSDASVRKEAIIGVVRNRSVSRRAIPILAKLKQDDPDQGIRALADEAHGNLTSGK